MKTKRAVMMGTILTVTAVVAIYPGTGPRSGKNDDITFHDARAQAAEFIGYYHSIPLTPDQEKTKSEALSGIPAPCCKDFSIATCCCPCNLAKSVWGLSHWLIAERGYDAPRVKQVVEQWIQFTNSRGYAGTACDEGRCGKSFQEDGCGGMNEKQIH